jgi:hypothetical protein
MNGEFSPDVGSRQFKTTVKGNAFHHTSKQGNSLPESKFQIPAFSLIENQLRAVPFYQKGENSS